MNKGCLFLLVLWAGLTGFWFYILRDTPLASDWWVPVLLALSVVIVCGNIIGLGMMIRLQRASKRTRSEWRDGDLVCVSGSLQANGAAVEAPFSGRSAVIIEYQIKPGGVHGSSNKAHSDFKGMIMSSCGVQTDRGMVPLVGFPLLAHIAERSVDDADAYDRAAAHLLRTRFEEVPNNPLAHLSQLTTILADDDGIVEAHFKDPTASVENLLAAGAEYEGDENDDDDEEWVGGVSGSTPQTSGPPSGQDESQEQAETRRARELGRALRDREYDLVETVVEDGAQVTVTGTFRGDRQAIDVGSGLKNLNHQVHLGAKGKVLGKQLTKSAAGLVFWSLVCVAGHWGLLHALGVDPRAALARITSDVNRLSGGR